MGDSSFDVFFGDFINTVSVPMLIMAAPPHHGFPSAPQKPTMAKIIDPGQLCWLGSTSTVLSTRQSVLNGRWYIVREPASQMCP